MFGYSGNGAADITLFRQDSGGSLLQIAISMDFRLGGRRKWAFQPPRSGLLALPRPNRPSIMTRSERALLVCLESGGYLVFIDDLSAFLK